MENKEEKGPENVDDKPSGSASGKRKSRYSDVEPRTPLKRQRVPVSRFQSPLEDLEVKFKIEKDEKRKDDNITLYKKNSFLAVRGAEGSFYLCRAAQNIYSKSKRLRIQWLSVDSPPNIYKFDYVDSTEMETVLTEVVMEKVSRDSYCLPESEQRRVEKILDRAIRVEQGVATADEVEEEAMEERDGGGSTDEEEDEPPLSKKGKAGKSSSAKEKKTKQATPARKKKGKEKLTKGKEKNKSGKQKEKVEKKKGPDRNLKPNPKIKVLEKDSLFETKEKAVKVSPLLNTLLAFRHVNLNDTDALKELLSQTEGVEDFNITRSPFDNRTLFDFAMKQGRTEIIKLLTKEVFGTENTVKRKLPPKSIISAMGTGSYNPAFLGIRNIRELNVSRGGKEGNQAFMKEHGRKESSEVFETLMSQGVSVDAMETFLHTMAACEKTTKDDQIHAVICNISTAVTYGYRHLAGKYVADAERLGGFGFNYLHKEVLTYENDDLRDIILASSVRKKPFSNDAITPLHCAAINPNVKYLTRLLSIEPDTNIQTRSRARPIHFAAACDGTGPLEFLLKRNASPLEGDNKGEIAIHYASRSGRANNIDVLMKHAKANSDKEGDYNPKWGLGCINRPNRFAKCALHLAVVEGHLDAVRTLIKHGADLNRPLSAGSGKLTPLMLAAQRGDLNCVRLFIQSGAAVEMLDKLKRSALTHAVINGCANVVSYLLFIGANPDRVDSSNNSLVHYAAAYGWYHCLRLLIKDAGAKPDLANDWQTTPITIAFMKGHHGLVEYLFSLKDVNINFKTDSGKTLISIACGTPLTEGLEVQIGYLVKNCKADPTIVDVDGCNALHHLATNSIKLKGFHWNPEVDPQAMTLSVKIAEILIAAGCDPTLRTNEGKTPTMLAIEQVNVDLIKFLVDNGGSVSPEQNRDEKTVLHLMAEQCCKTNLTPIIKVLAKPQKTMVVVDQPKENGTSEANETIDAVNEKNDAEESMDVDQAVKAIEKPAADDQAKVPPENNINGDEDKAKPVGIVNEEKGKAVSMEVEKEKQQESIKPDLSQQEVLKKMATTRDFSGFTPLLRACEVYKNFKPSKQSDNDKEAQQALEFIEALLELTGADINALVGPKNIPDDPMLHYAPEGGCSALHFMINPNCETNNVGAGLNLILRFSPNCNLKNVAEETSLALAVTSSKENAVKSLLENGADPNNLIKEPCFMVTPLVLAAQRGSFKIMDLLIMSKADVMGTRTDLKQNALHILVTNRAHEDETIAMIQKLLSAGANINAMDVNGNTPLHLAVQSNKGHSDTSTSLEEFLLDQGADCFTKSSQGRLPLHEALCKNGIDPIELCSLLTGMMRDQRVDESCKSGFTPLLLAASSGATICCMHLLQRRANLEAKEHRGNTPLNLAIENGFDSCAIMLMQRSASLSNPLVISLPRKEEKKEEEEKKKKRPVLTWRPKKQWERSLHKEIPGKRTTIFERAVEKNLTGVAHMLLDALGVPMTIIESALNLSKFYLALRLLRRIPDANRLHAKNKDGQNLFHVLALKTSSQHPDLQIKVAGALFEKGVHLSDKDKFGMTPLMYAAMNHQSIELARFLIVNDLRFDPKVKEIKGKDCMAAFMWDFEWVSDKYKTDMTRQWLELLIDEGKMTLDTLYDHPLPDFLLLGSTISCDQPDFFDSKCEDKTTPLIFTIRNYEFGLAKYMLQKGSNANFPDSKGRTPMMHAVEMNDIKMVKLLLNYSYDPEKEGVGEHEINFKPQLSKESSRQVFTIDFQVAKEKNPDDVLDEEANEDEDIEDDAASLSKHTEENEDSVVLDEEFGSEPEEFPEEDEEEDMPEEDEMDDDQNEGNSEASDHDTDVMENEDFVEVEENLKTFDLTTKLSLTRHMSSLKREKEFKGFEKTSPVDLSITDKKHWTAIHHAVCSLQSASFDNAEIVFILGKAGAPLQAKNNKGETAMDLAKKNNSEKIVRILSKRLAEEPYNKVVEPFVGSPASFVVQETVPGIVKPNYTAHSEAMLDKLDAGDKAAVDLGDTPPVDANCEISKVGEVARHKTTNIPYSVTLSKVDVTCGFWGMYNFYKLQIIRHKAKNLFILFTRWGRIGDRGQFQHTPYQNLEDAAKEFCKVYKSKTGNDWNQTTPYINRPKKYRLMPKPEKQRKQHKVNFHFDTSLSSKLPEPVLDLISEMSSVVMFEASIHKFGLNEDFMPFGRMNRQTLLEARKVLTDISELIDKVSKQKDATFPENVAEYQSNCEEIAKLTNEYYHLIPKSGFENESISPIFDKKTLRYNTKLLSDIMDMQIANTILLGANYRKSEMNPMDYIYSALGCTIQPMAEDDIETQFILTNVHATVPTATINRIFKLSREGEQERLSALNMPNHQLLWHGSSMSNFLSILSRGLLVTPPEVPWTGHLFGEGIYFADTFVKSSHYCHNQNPKSSCKAMLLCEVALGNPKIDVTHGDEDHLDDDINSLKILGKTCPISDFNVHLPFGASIDLGQVTSVRYKPPARLTHNEYIIHNADQIVLRYLVLFNG